MRRMTLLAALLVLAGVVAVVPSYAHEGHKHTVMGTVVAQHDGQLEVKTTDGKTVTVGVNAKTSVLKGKTKADLAAVTAGQRVVVDLGDGKAPVTAREIKLGAAAR